MRLALAILALSVGVQEHEKFLTWDESLDPDGDAVHYEVLAGPFDGEVYVACVTTDNTWLTWREFVPCIRFGDRVIVVAIDEHGARSGNGVELATDFACLKVDIPASFQPDPASACEERCYDGAPLRLAAKYEECSP